MTLHNTKCYICKYRLDNPCIYNKYLCLSCFQYNNMKRYSSRDLTDKVAIVTGGRIKIGYYTALRLLRSNATVIITTRFKYDALCRYSKEEDFAMWRERLYIIPCNFLYKTHIDALVSYIDTHFPCVHYLINNAAQTIYRPEKFYTSLIDNEVKYESIFGAKYCVMVKDITVKDITVKDICIPNEVYHTPLKRTKELLNDEKYFPINEVDEHGQQLDIRHTNSWVETIETVDITEVMEVMLINSITPFYLIQKLLPYMKSDGDMYIINVSSMEGKFNRKKQPIHPHTNMAKASLNMITKTNAKYIEKKYGIIMVSVDTGWNTIEEPLSYDIVSPLDCVDGSSRILDPIYCQLAESGVFYKDFKPTEW